MFPMFLKLEGRRCLVVGAGTVAEGKIRGLLEAGASVQVVAPEAVLQIQKWAWDGAVGWSPRGFQPHDLDGAFLVITATASPEVNAQVFHEARERKVLCNSVDDPEHCDFYYPAVVNRGDLQIAPVYDRGIVKIAMFWIVHGIAQDFSLTSFMEDLSVDLGRRRRGDY